MAVDLSAEIKNRKIADSLTNGGDDETDSESDPSTDEPEETESTEEPDAEATPAPAPAEPAPAAANKVPTFADDVIASAPVQPTTQRAAPVSYPTITDEPTGGLQPAFTPPTDQAQPSAQAMRIPWGATPINIPSEPLPIQTDDETGTRYIIDPDTGKMVPHAELVSAEDKAAQPTGGRELQRIEVTGKDYYAPEEGLPMPPEVRRGQLIKLPPSQPSPETGLPVPSDEVRRAQLVGAPPPKAQLVPPTPSQAVSEQGLPVTPTPPKIEPGQLISVPPGTAPKAQPVTVAAPQPPAQAPVQQQAPVQPTPGKVATFADDLQPKPAAAQQPAGQQPTVPKGGQIGVADFFAKRGDQPISSAKDPRLTTVTVGDQNYRVNKEAAPSFQGFLNDLAANGAPVQAGDSWVYREKVGAKGLSDHAYGGAIDVNQGSLDRNKVSPAFQKWIDANPGVLQQIEKRWNIYGGERFGDLGHFEWGGVPLRQPTTAQPAVPGQVPAEAPIDIQSQSYTKGRTQEPTKLILHSTDGASEQADINTLTGAEPGHQVSVNYYVTKDGRVMHFVSEGDTAWHAGADRFGGNGNAYTLGIEQQHVDGKEPWPDAQVRATAGVAAGILARHPNMTIDDVIGHSDLAGERKQDPVDYPWAKFRQYVAEAQQGQPAAGTTTTAAVPSAQPVTKLKTGFYQDEKPGDFLNGRVTTFATSDDIASGQDNGVGSPHLGRLDTTQVAGVAIPQWVLQQYFGNSTAAMRQARVDVVDPQTGKRLRVPIVDIGPGGGPENAGVIADMTPALSSYFGGDKNLSIKIVPKAGPDVMRNPQLFYDEQAAIKNGFDSGSLQANRQVIGPKFASVAQTPEEATAAQQKVQQAIQKQQDIVSTLPEVKGGNVIDAYNRLDQGVDGVSPAYIKNAQANLKQEAIAQVRQKYPEIKTDDDAWKVAQTPAWQSTAPITELGTAVYAGYTKADLAFNQMMQGADANRLTDFARALHPDYKPEGLTAFVKSITDIQDPTQRSQMIGHLMANLPESTQSMFDSVALSDSADRVGSPAYQKAQSDALAAKRTYLDHLESPDPRLKGSWIEKGAQLIGSVPAMASLWETGGFGQSLFVSQIYLDTKDKLQQQHPDWNADQINDTAKKSAIAQSIPQGILAAISAGQLGRVGEMIEQWTGGKISFGGIGRAMEGVENPALRAIIGAAPHIVTGAGASAAQQAAGNIAEGRPVGEGVLQAAGAGAVMGGPAGIAHGIGAAMRPGERAEVAPSTEEARPVAVQPPAQPPVEQRPAPTVLTPEQEFPTPEAQLAEQQRRRAGLPPAPPEPAAQAQQELYPVDQNGQPKVSEAEPWVSQIANRFTAERMATGELGAVEPGVGVSTEEMLARGAKMSPEEINQHASNIMNDVGGNPGDQAAAIRTEEARLSQVSRNASLASEANPGNAQLRIDADNAFKDLTDWHNGPVAKLKNDWHAQGKTMQGERPVDLSSYNGLRDEWMRTAGKGGPGNPDKPPPPEMEPAMRNTAKRVRAAIDAESATMRNLGAEIERQSAGRKLPSDEEVRNKIMAKMKDLPCPT